MPGSVRVAGCVLARQRSSAASSQNRLADLLIGGGVGWGGRCTKPSFKSARMLEVLRSPFGVAYLQFTRTLNNWQKGRSGEANSLLE